MRALAAEFRQLNRAERVIEFLAFEDGGGKSDGRAFEEDTIDAEFFFGSGRARWARRSAVAPS